jgi:hypothetical protein
MNATLHLPSTLAASEAFALLGILFSAIIAILWVVIGWRAMKAHERIAAVAAEWLQQQPVKPVSYPRHTAPQSKEQPEKSQQ